MTFRQKDTIPKKYNILEKLKIAAQVRTEDANVRGEIPPEIGVNKSVRVGNLGNLASFEK